VLVALLVELEVHLVEHLVVLGLGDRVPLGDGVELFEEHRLDGLASEVEQDGPGLGHVARVDVHEVQSVNVRVEKQVVVALGELGQFLTSNFEVLGLVKRGVHVGGTTVINALTAGEPWTGFLHLIVIENKRISRD